VEKEAEMELNARPYQDDEDYWRIREFLRQVMLRNDRREFSWHVARLDYWWWFINKSIEKIVLEENIFLWEMDAGRIAAVLNPEVRGQAFLQLDPDLISPDLLEDMVRVAESHLASPARDGRLKLQVFADSNDTLLHAILTRHGFQRLEFPEVSEFQHRRVLDDPLPEPVKIPGYTIRTVGYGLELLERCYASGLGFHQDDIQVARDNRDHPEWYQGLQLSPLYRRDLDIVAVADDGSVASFCTIWFDDFSRTAYIEPLPPFQPIARRDWEKPPSCTGCSVCRKWAAKRLSWAAIPRLPTNCISRAWDPHTIFPSRGKRYSNRSTRMISYGFI